MSKERKTVADTDKLGEPLSINSSMSLDLLVFAQHMLIKSDIDKVNGNSLTESELQSNGSGDSEDHLTNEGHNGSQHGGGVSERSMSDAQMHDLSATESRDAEHWAAGHPGEARVSAQTLLSTPAILNEILSNINGLPAVWELRPNTVMMLPHSGDAAAEFSSQVFWLGSEGHQVAPVISPIATDEVSVRGDHSSATTLAIGNSDNNFWTSGGPSSPSYPIPLAAAVVSIFGTQSFGTSADASSATSLISQGDGPTSGTATFQITGMSNDVIPVTTQANPGFGLSNISQTSGLENNVASPEPNTNLLVVPSQSYFPVVLDTGTSASHTTHSSVAALPSQSIPTSSLSDVPIPIDHAPGSSGPAAGSGSAVATISTPTAPPASAAGSNASSSDVPSADGASSIAVGSTGTGVNPVSPFSPVGITIVTDPGLPGPGINTPTASEIATVVGELATANQFSQGENIPVPPTLSSVLFNLEQTAAANLGSGIQLGDGSAGSITSTASLGESLLDMAAQQIQAAANALVKANLGSNTILSEGGSSNTPTSTVSNGFSTTVSSSSTATDHITPGILVVTGATVAATTATSAAQQTQAATPGGSSTAADHITPGIVAAAGTTVADTAATSAAQAQQTHATMTGGDLTAVEHITSGLVVIASASVAVTGATSPALQTQAATLVGNSTASDHITPNIVAVAGTNLTAAERASLALDASGSSASGIVVKPDHNSLSIALVVQATSNTSNVHIASPANLGNAGTQNHPEGVASQSGWGHGLFTMQLPESLTAPVDKFDSSHAEGVVSYGSFKVVEYGPAGSAPSAGLRGLLLQHLMTHQSATTGAHDSALTYHLTGHVDENNQHTNEYRHDINIAQSEAHHSLTASQNHMPQHDNHDMAFSIDHLH